MTRANSSAPRFVLVGASLDTGNLGVSALLTATVKCILAACPDARIDLFEGTRTPQRDEVELADGRVVPLGRVGIRYHKRLWRREHLVRLLLTALLARCLPVRAWRERLRRGNPYLRALVEAEAVADITGGDSFSDLYGMRRFLVCTLFKLLALAAGARLVLLPQTYGPFRSRLARWMARYVLRRADAVYVRERLSLGVIDELAGPSPMRSRPRLVPDVAFVLDALPRAVVPTEPPEPGLLARRPIGLNVSGLLYHADADQRARFGLRDDYAALMERVAATLLDQTDVPLLLVPHVLVPDAHPESDARACRSLRARLEPRYPGRVFQLAGEYTAGQVKHVIGGCEFFVGSRMHACIAAASQGVPVVPLAYSDKFRGVFETLGAGELVVDLRRADRDETARSCVRTFQRRASIRAALEATVGDLQRQVLALFATDVPATSEVRREAVAVAGALS
ncbi:MAG: polysaccharide pyruvyl transferase family protein [Phycisphaerales bacterium]|nr:polysaccharide pyruvyl transferase family protein [Phycisphaerales bacterium]